MEKFYKRTKRIHSFILRIKNKRQDRLPRVKSMQEHNIIRTLLHQPSKKKNLKYFFPFLYEPASTIVCYARTLIMLSTNRYE